MSQDVSSFIERYQLIYEKDPDSKVFAPLAEAYRRMGLLHEAIELAERGVRKHPHFASGRVCLGKCYFQKGEYQKAIDELKEGAKLSPENLLAHQLLAQCYLKLNKFSDALNAYKMILFINPQDSQIAKKVEDLERRIFTDQNSAPIEEDFSMEKITEVASKAAAVGWGELEKTPTSVTAPVDGFLERELALLDNRYDRADWDNFKSQLEKLLAQYPGHPELEKRKLHLLEVTQTQYEVGPLIRPLETAEDQKNKRVGRLQSLLQVIEIRRKDTLSQSIR